MSFIKKSYKRRIFFCFLALSIVFILLSGIFSVQLFRLKINRDFVQSDIEAFRNIRKSLDSAFEETENALGRIGDNETLIHAAAGDESDERNVNSELFANTRQIREYSSTEIYNGGNCIYSTSAGTPGKALTTYFSALKRADESEGRTVYANSNRYEGGETALEVVKRISDGGYCVVRINTQGFDRLLDGLVGSGKGFLIVNEFWEPVYTTGTANAGTVKTFRDNLFARTSFDSGFADNAYVEKLGETGLWGVYITPPVMIGSAVRSMYTVILLLTAVSIGLSFLLSSRLSNALSRPIGNLTRAMKKLRGGDLSTRMTVEGEDEFGQLAGGFNKMAEQLQKHVEERIEKEKELNRTQIGMVTAQLNPHFLYNTLDTIKWLAKDSGVQTIADLSSKLAKILRRSISGPAFCTLNDELELVRNYCDIQAVRFDNKFEVSIETEESVGECVIPKLIIQPVVENAIIHGLADCDSGRIDIDVRRVAAAGGAYYNENGSYDAVGGYYDNASGDIHNGEDIASYRDSSDGNPRYGRQGRNMPENKEAGKPCGGIIVICVTDNGCGIDPETAGMLRNRDKEGLEGHIGLLNVDTIIRLNYGSEYGLTAERTGESGTKVTITLPEMK